MESICFQFINISRETFHMLDVEEVRFISPLPAEDSHWAIPKWHRGMFNLSQVRGHMKYWQEAHWRSSPSFALLMVTDSFPWFERREKARHVHFVALAMWTGCPAFLLSLKTESPLGVAQTITAGRIIWTPGTSEHAQLSVQLEENVGSNWATMGISDYSDVLLGQIPALPGEVMILWFSNGP